MAVTRSVKIKLAYDDATSRTYTFNGVESMYLPDVKDKVIAINASLEAGTASNFANTFVSNNGSPCKMISEAKVIVTNQEVIYSAS